MGLDSMPSHRQPKATALQPAPPWITTATGKPVGRNRAIIEEATHLQW